MTKKTGLIAGVAVILIAMTVIFLAQKKAALAEERNCDGCTTCKYDTLLLPAKIISIDTMAGNGNIRVAVKRPVPPHGDKQQDITDTVEFLHHPPYKLLTQEEITKANVKKGDLLQCTCYSIVAGSCDPYIYILSLAAFKQK